MTIDVNCLRPEKGGDISAVRVSQERRGRSGEEVDALVELDNSWRRAIFAHEDLKKRLNALNKQVAVRKKASPSDACADLLEESSQLKSELPELEKQAQHLEKSRDAALHKIGNFVHTSVPVSNDEKNNRVERTWGVPSRFVCDGTPGRMHHHQILAALNGVEFKKGVDVAGHRGYYLKGAGLMLNMALVQYGLSFLMKKGYTPVQPPFFMRKELMGQAAELKDFDETLYKIPHDKSAAPPPENLKGSPLPSSRDDGDDLYLIATSEQPLCCLHRNEALDESKLPIKYAGVSTCFRKEAGSHGKDCWGIFRVHQFEKIEQFCITTPEKSWEMHAEMIGVAESFYESLELPYRVVSIVSGALNDAAAKKFDLEAWFPGYEDFRELVSCSNCTDYQARDLGIYLGHKKQGTDRVHVHMLNATLVATQRCLCCILENYQTEKGVRVPRVLVPFMGGQEFLHYANTEAPENPKREMP